MSPDQIEFFRNHRNKNGNPLAAMFKQAESKELTLKEKLHMAYEAGINSVAKNKEIDQLIDDGTKHCPERPSFESWLSNINSTLSPGHRFENA